MALIIDNILAVGNKRSQNIARVLGHDMRMDSRKILADNIRTLKEYAGLPNAKLATKCGVSNGTISNALLAKNALDIDTLDAIAKAFHLSAWQLLVPNLDPRNPHHITNISDAEAELYARLKSVLKSSQ